MGHRNIDDDFKSLSDKIKISDIDKRNSHTHILTELNNKKVKRNRNPKIKYYMTLATAIVLFIILASTLPNLFDSTEQPNVGVEEMTSLIQNERIIGMSQDELTTKLGSDYTEVIAAKDTEVTSTIDEKWRYDINPASNYEFDEVYDFADIEGLTNGEVEMQIFITWDNNYRLHSVNALYKDSSNKLMIIEKLPDGTFRIEPLGAN